MMRNIYLILMILFLTLAATGFVKGLDCFYKAGYSKNGRKKVAAEFPGGEWRWKCTYWYENGQKKREGEIYNGKEQGKWTWWDASGRVAKEAEYRAGVEIK